MSEKKTSREEKGITLVALVITVVIMLILAGVAISAVVNGDGLFNKVRESVGVYENVVQDENDKIESMLNEIDNYLNNSQGSTSDGSFNSTMGVNTPDTSALPIETTKYVTWNYNETDGVYEEQILDNIPDNWYNYENGEWANIKTTANGLEAYWVWVPRFAYKLPESDTAKEIEVAFIKNNGTETATGEKAYYVTDAEITADGSGLYVQATDFAKGTLEGQEQAWIIHPAFTFGNVQLNGIWVAKYEVSNNNDKVEIKPNIVAWDEILTADIFQICRQIQNTGGTVGTTAGNTAIDTHMMKNIEWGAVAVLSQSTYGIFNPTSSTGVNGDETYKVWNNPNVNKITGMVSNSENGADAASLEDNMCDEYNVGNGPKASTTGTVYGVYDMAGGCFEYVAGVLAGAEYDKLGTTDERYYDAYINPSQIASDYTGGKIGDLTAELLPNQSTARTWNDDQAGMIRLETSSMHRGGGYNNGKEAGIFKFNFNNSGGTRGHSFRSTIIIF